MITASQLRKSTRDTAGELCMSSSTPELFNASARAVEYKARLTAFMDEHVYPNEAIHHQQGEAGNRWQPRPIVEDLKSRARAAGLWNLFLPDSEYGVGLSNFEY